MEKYFKPVRESKPQSKLPDPFGPLSSSISPPVIKSVNKKIEELDSSAEKGKRRQYTKIPIEMKTKIGKYAAENGVPATVIKFKRCIGESAPPPNWRNTIRDWKNSYLRELDRKRKAGEDIDNLVLPQKKRGRPLLLGEHIDKQVQEYITQLRCAGGVVNTPVVIATGVGIVESYDANLLSSNGGHIDLGKDWAKSLMRRMNLVKRKATTKSSSSTRNFDEVRDMYLSDIAAVTVMEEVPLPLIINWDQTGVNFVPYAEWTMEVKGSRRVEVAGLCDKRQMTAVFAGSADGNFLPVQLIYSGTTSKCLPRNVCFPSDWHVTSTINHWSNEGTMLDYLDKIIAPYVQKQRQELGLACDHSALVLFDHFSGQITPAVFNKLDTYHIIPVLIPPCCTDRLQPMDLSVNKPAKAFLRSSFQSWYAKKIVVQLQQDKKKLDPVDTRLSVIKPIHAEWLIQLYEYIKSRPDIVIAGFKAAGILDKINDCVATDV